MTDFEDLTKTALVGGSACVFSLALVPFDVKFMGLPAPITIGLVAGASSYASSLASDTIYEAVLPESESDLLYSATAPIVTGVGTSAIAYAALGKHADAKALAEFFALGALSEVSGGYINDNMLGAAVDLD
jgi:hypothetical protein